MRAPKNQKESKIHFVEIKALMHGDRVLLSCLLVMLATCMYNSLLMVTPDVANEH